MGLARSLVALLYVSVLLAMGGQARADDAAGAPPLPLEPASTRFAAPSQSESPDFQKHVVPLLGRQGCNGRACHGSFQGRGGFRLSLFGFDFKMDHAALTGASETHAQPRVSTKSPEQSLVLQKPTLQIDHEGGNRLNQDSWQYRLLHRWIEQGAKRTEKPSKLRSLEISPSELLFANPEQSIQLKVVAVWDDGAREDVTCLSRFRTNNDAVVEMDRDGAATAKSHGDTDVVVFYDNGVAAIPVMVNRSNDAKKTPWPIDRRTTQIDRLVNRRLRKLGIRPSEICTDAEFLRRASIDLTGTLPPPDEVERFLADDAADKRDRKIDELLKRPAFAAWWANKLCDFTGCNPNQQAELGQRLAEQWYMWIYARLREGAPFDEIVERIVLSRGRGPNQSYDEFAEQVSSYFRDESPADFAERETMPHYWSRRTLKTADDKALAFAHSFLGLRLQCAQCHKHPWDQWTQDDFKQFSAFFENVAFGVAPDAKQRYSQLAKKVGLQVRGNNGSPVRPDTLAKAQMGQRVPWRELYVAERKQPVKLSLLRSGMIDLGKRDDPREPIMAWMRDPQNPWFARAIVNRVWASCFSIGIVDPPDDLNAANPPSNPELLDWLAAEFVRQDFDLRWLLREIVRSNAWQRSWRANASNADDSRNFSRNIPRRIPAEVVYDALKQVTAASDQHQTVRLDLSRRAVGHLSMRMAGTYAMHVFGKPERAVSCDCERVNQPTLLQAVFLQNDPIVHMRLQESGWIAEIAAFQPKSDAELENAKTRWVREAWLRALGRPPNDAESKRGLKHIRDAESPQAGVADLVWALVNTKEFLLNH